MKTAYELALERMESQGIEPPSEDALSTADRERMSEIRSRAEAKIAELKIYHDQRMAKLTAGERHAEEAEYQRDRQRLEAKRDHDLEAVREASRRTGG